MFREARIEIPNTVPKTAWVLLLAIVIAATLLVWLSPAERTLGNGIKVVYVHVSFTWAGMVGFLLAGALGLAGLVHTGAGLDKWTRVVSWVAWSWFFVGFVLSLWAAQVNWGAIYWQEPRVLASVKFVVLSLIALVVSRWLSSQLRGGLLALLAFFLMWSILGTPLVMHPEGPIRTSSSSAIQLTFLGMFILSSMAAIWFAWFCGRAKIAKADPQ